MLTQYVQNVKILIYIHEVVSVSQQGKDSFITRDQAVLQFSALGFAQWALILPKVG
jgi:hypothetical protein